MKRRWKTRKLIKKRAKRKRSNIIAKGYHVKKECLDIIVREIISRHLQANNVEGCKDCIHRVRYPLCLSSIDNIMFRHIRKASY